MLKTEQLKNATRIYSDEGRPIKDLATNHVYSECVVVKPNLENYIEVELNKN